MTPLSPKRQFVIGTWLPWLTLVLLLLLSYATLVVAPYSGFNLRFSTGELYIFYSDPSGLELGDIVQAIGPVTREVFNANAWQQLFEGVEPGDTVPITIERDGQTLVVPYVFPGPTRREFFERLNSQWIIGLFFGLAALITALVVRPKDARWTLLIAFFCLNAAWLTSSATASSRHVLGVQFLLRTLVWLTVPVFLHLHWNFPAPLGRLPRWVWPALYGLCLAIGLAEWLLPRLSTLYLFSLLTALVGSIVLLFMQWRKQTRLRRDVALLFWLNLAAMLPVIAFIVASRLALTTAYSVGSLLALLLIPTSYLLVINRRKLAGLQWRINRYISAYLYFVVMASIFIVGLGLLAATTSDATGALVVGSLAALAATLLTLLFQHRAARWLERRLLGMRLAPEQVLADFSAQITASLDFDRLAHVLRDTVLPSLLVREAALLRLDEASAPQPLFLLGVTADQMPTAAEAATLAQLSGRYRPPETTAGAPCPWVLLPLALTHQGRTIGLWLLGRQDPDDFYAREEIEQLTQLANQAAVALSNSVQAAQLHLLYRRDVDQAELERKRLAQELHDGPMNELAQLGNRLPADTPAEVLAGYHAVITDLRRIVTNLRPATLNYGLYPALRSLAVEVEERLGPEQGLALEVEASGERYDPGVEQHVFRIVQQACGNALQHAQPRHIHLSGRLEPGRLELSVRDDGRGFPGGAAPDLNALLAQRHYGLAGIYERAALVEAAVSVQSTVGSGTQVQVIWPRPAPN